ncbi:MAG: 3'(2'),5'-bisphosphate nucleotidase [Planctomycetota bacterium]|nr:MAG: 3'(2'),5'-bisphosphate nucleotidase [Planctomycetota bacterium]
MSSRWEQELQTAVEAVVAAAAVCRLVQSELASTALEKNDRSPVTVADFAAQALICRALRSAFPQDPIIAEEDAADLGDPANAPFAERIVEFVRRAGVAADLDDVRQWIDLGDAARSTGRVWALDPVDGTKGFLRGEQYAVALGLIVDGRLRVAVLACPNLPERLATEKAAAGRLFGATEDGPAWTAPLSAPRRRATIRVSSTPRPQDARFCESVESGHSSHELAARIARLLGITRPPVRLDSQAKYAVVARGEADIYLRLPVRRDYREKIWDHAAGTLIVERAGGRVSDVEGRPLDFSRGPRLDGNRGVVVTNGALHDAVITAVRRVMRESHSG